MVSRCSSSLSTWGVALGSVLNIVWLWSNKRQLGWKACVQIDAWSSLCFLRSSWPLERSDSSRGLSNMGSIFMYRVLEDDSLVIAFAVTLRLHAIAASRTFFTALDTALPTS